eukprot:5166351-Alexandrium_andersonii.AAC.1
MRNGPAPVPWPAPARGRAAGRCDARPTCERRPPADQRRIPPGQSTRSSSSGGLAVAPTGAPPMP